MYVWWIIIFGIFKHDMQIFFTRMWRLMRTRLLNESRMCTHWSTESVHELQQFKGHSKTKIDLSPREKITTDVVFRHAYIYTLIMLM